MKHLEEIIIDYDKKLTKANIEIERLEKALEKAIETNERQTNKIERLHSIIEEVREYIEPLVELDNDIMLKGKMLKPVLEILDKEKDNV